MNLSLPGADHIPTPCPPANSAGSPRLGAAPAKKHTNRGLFCVCVVAFCPFCWIRKIIFVWCYYALWGCASRLYVLISALGWTYNAEALSRGSFQHELR